jgi:hypothetical protein
MAALAGLVPLARRTRSEGGAGDKVASKVLQLASCMLEDQVGGQYSSELSVLFICMQYAVCHCRCLRAQVWLGRILVCTSTQYVKGLW